MKVKDLLNVKKLFTLLVVALPVLLVGCLGMTTKPKAEVKVITKLKLTADSGYVSKSDVFVFLQTNSLTDTLSDWWKQWRPADTMGKYYKTENGNFLLCVLTANTANNSVEVNKLVELDRNGTLVVAKDYYSDACNINHRTEALGRVGNYFVTYSCGHGSGFEFSYFHLFGKLSEREGGNEILAKYYLNNIQCKTVTSAWKVSHDTCIVNYNIVRGKSTEDGCVPVDSFKTSIRYYTVDGKWRAADSSKIKQMGVVL